VIEPGLRRNMRTTASQICYDDYYYASMIMVLEKRMQR